MRSLIIFAAFLIFSVESQSCGNLSESANQWPWTVSIFSNASNMVLCQGSIISNKDILTAGHCLQHKDPSGVFVYPGFMSYRWKDNHQLVWQVEQINLHPDLKLTSRARFINGGFVASMEIHADLAIATLKEEIQFNDIITPICLPIDDSIENTKVHGSYSGWNMNTKNVESLNATIEAIGDAEMFEVPVDEKRVDFVTGTGFYSRINSSWMIVGLMETIESENDIEMIKFINIHKYVNWITNVTQSTSLPTTTTSIISSIETSTTSTDSSSAQTSTLSLSPSLLSTPSAQNSSFISSVKPLVSNQERFTTTPSESSSESTITTLSASFEKTTVNPSSSTTSASQTTVSQVTASSFSEISTNDKTTSSITEQSTVASKSNSLSTQNNSASPKLYSTNIQLSTTPSVSITTDQQSSSTISLKTTDQQTTSTESTPKAAQENNSIAQVNVSSTHETTETTTKASSSSPSSAVANITLSQLSTTLHQNLLSNEASFTEPSTVSKEKRTTIRMWKTVDISSTVTPLASSTSQETTQPSSSDATTTTESSSSSQSSSTSTHAVTSTTPQKLTSMVETNEDSSTPLISTSTDMPVSKTTSANEEATKTVSTIKEKSSNDFSSTTELNIDSVTEIPKIIASNLQAAYNKSFIPRLAEGRSLKDFDNNVSQTIENLSTISNRLPSVTLPTLATTTINPVKDDIINTTSLPSLNSVSNVTTEASPSIMNSTDSNDNSTTTISSEDVVIGGIDFSPAWVITGVCIASVLVLFLIFGLLSLSKPETPH